MVNKIQDVLLHAGLHHGYSSGSSSPRSLERATSGSSPSPRPGSSQALTRNLPVIAVIGSQSSGKSSLLESLVGTDFLPKSNEICTKCPLVLQLVQSSWNGEDGSPAHAPAYGEFLHRRGRKYYDFAQVKEEILAETERVVGKGSVRVSDGASPCLRLWNASRWDAMLMTTYARFSGVRPPTASRRVLDVARSMSPARCRSLDVARSMSLARCRSLTRLSRTRCPEPIRLRIVSPSVLTMTLVDLPGLIRVPVGDQPADIEKQVRRLILKYISAPQCVILAVSPANQDLASSDALELARSVDPDGLRTVGVLTKLDIMDRGTNAVRMLRNEVRCSNASRCRC